MQTSTRSRNQEADVGQRGTPAPPAIIGACLAPVQCLHLLAAFAFYAGVGQKTAMGMGQTRRLRQADMLHGAPASAPAALHQQQEDEPSSAALAAAGNAQEALHAK